ncbi:MAG TPA: oxidoreductase [Chloroflexia bacterium]|nr:oxidoreductase [Chloroflexia bacterium]
MREVTVGVVGYGLSGAVFHAPLITSVDGYRLKTIVSSNPAKVTADYPEVQVAPTVEDLLADPEIELVVIGAPNSAHFPVARQSLLAGKHVVVDKPFTNTTQEAEELIQLAEQNDRLLSVFQNRRWDNDFLTVKACLKSGLLGELYSYESHYDRFRLEVRNRWREIDLPGSGMLFDLGAHLIDQALHLFGTPESIYADLHKQRPGSKVIDYFHLLLDYGRLRVILHSGMVIKSPGPRYQLHGTKGSFIKYGLDSQEDALKAGMRPGDAGWGADKPEFYGELTTEVEGATLTGKMETLPGSYESYYIEVLKAIREGAPLPVRAEEGLNTIKVIEKALQSSQEKREVAF